MKIVSAIVGSPWLLRSMGSSSRQTWKGFAFFSHFFFLYVFFSCFLRLTSLLDDPRCTIGLVRCKCRGSDWFLRGSVCWRIYLSDCWQLDLSFLCWSCQQVVEWGVRFAVDGAGKKPGNTFGLCELQANLRVFVRGFGCKLGCGQVGVIRRI